MPTMLSDGTQGGTFELTQGPDTAIVRENMNFIKTQDYKTRLGDVHVTASLNTNDGKQIKARMRKKGNGLVNTTINTFLSKHPNMKIEIQYPERRGEGA